MYSPPTITLLLCLSLLPTLSQEQSCSTDESSCPDDPANEVRDPLEFWHTYTIDDLFHHFHCPSILPYNVDDDILPPPPPAPRSLQERALSPSELASTMNMMERLRIKYKNEVNAIPVADSDEAESVFVAPVFVGNAGVKGRGIYAAEDISRGSLVLDVDSRNVGIFKDAAEWRRFTYSLGVEDEELACNFMEWCWIQTVEKDQEEEEDIRHGLTVFLAFDESGLVNNAEWGDETANIRCGTLMKEDEHGETWSSCRYRYHATRDIKAGEEILINYSEFEDATQTGWVDFGVGIGITTADQSEEGAVL